MPVSSGYGRDEADLFGRASHGGKDRSEAAQQAQKWVLDQAYPDLVRRGRRHLLQDGIGFQHDHGTNSIVRQRGILYG